MRRQAASSPDRVEVRKLIAEKFDAKPVADVAALLRHADMRIRQKAQFELVRRGDAQPLTRGAQRRPSARARSRDLGIGQLARKDAKHAALLTPLARRHRRRDPRAGGKDDRRRALRAGGQGAAAAAQGFRAARALLRRRGARPDCVQAGDGADRRDAGGERRQGRAAAPCRRLALSRIGDAAALAPLSTHPSKGVRIAAVVALRRLRHADAARFLADADQRSSLEAARAINDDGGIEAALPSLARLLEAKRFTATRSCGARSAPTCELGEPPRVDPAGGVCRRHVAAGTDARRSHRGDWRLPVAVADGSRRRLSTSARRSRVSARPRRRR